MRGTIKKDTIIIIAVKILILKKDAITTFKLEFKTKCMEVGVTTMKQYITSENGMTNVKHFACKAGII